MTKTVSVILVFTFFIACVSKKPVVKTTAPTPAENKVQVSPFLNQDQSPEMVYNEKCGSCHKAYNPADYTEADWKAIVPNMVSKANETTINIGPGQQELILKYLSLNAKK